jgi:hypothetical protein
MGLGTSAWIICIGFFKTHGLLYCLVICEPAEQCIALTGRSCIALCGNEECAWKTIHYKIMWPKYFEFSSDLVLLLCFSQCSRSLLCHDSSYMRSRCPFCFLFIRNAADLLQHIWLCTPVEEKWNKMNLILKSFFRYITCHCSVSLPYLSTKKIINVMISYLVYL